MFFFLMFVVSTFIIGRTVRDTLFLHRVSLANLPLMYMLVAAAVAPASWLYSRIADRYRRDRLLAATLAGFVLLTLGFWTLIQAQVGAWVYIALYIAVEVIGAISVMQFWTFANDIFSGRQAKRLFGVIGAGGVLANIICGFGIGALAPIIGSEDLLLVVAGLFAVCVLLVRSIAVRWQHDLELAIRRPKRSRFKLGTEGGRVLSSKHLQIIAGIVVVTFLTVTLVDFQFKVLVRSHYSSEIELASYFGYFYALTGIVASLMQFFITARVLERSGIVVALSVLPVAMGFGVTGIVMVPLISAITAATLAKGAENIFRYTLNDATMQLLYVPVPSHRRGRAKAFIDGILKQGSIATSGLLLFVLGHMMAAETLAYRLAYVDIAFLIIWLTLVIGIRREYVNSLIDTLRARRLDLSEAWSPVVDDGTQRLLQKRLHSEEEEEVLTTLELLESLDADVRSDLFHLLGHPSEEIRIRALALIGDAGMLEGAQQIHDLCRDPSPRVRSAAITAFCAVARERAINGVRSFLHDDDAQVRASAAAAMIQHGGLDGILTAAETLKAFLNSADPQDRLHGARVLRDIKVRNFFQPVLTLLQDEDPRVRMAAVEAAGEMQSPELVPALIYKLADAPTAMAAVRALVAHGPTIERTLFKVLKNTREDIRVRRRIPKVLERVGRQDAFEQLVCTLDTKDPELRSQIARAAARIRERHPHLKIDEAPMQGAFREQIRAAYQTLAILMDLDLPSEHLLSEALVVRYRSHLALAFALLEIRYPPATIQLIHANLDSENKAIRANALEVADNVLNKEEARLILPLLEEHTLPEQVQKGRETFSTERRKPEAWLEQLIDDAHPWVVSCTIHHVAALGLKRFIPRMKAHLDSRDPVVRETAAVALERLIGAPDAPYTDDLDELAKKTRRLVDDDVVEVRRAAAHLLATLKASPAV